MKASVYLWVCLAFTATSYTIPVTGSEGETTVDHSGYAAN